MFRNFIFLLLLTTVDCFLSRSNSYEILNFDQHKYEIKNFKQTHIYCKQSDNKHVYNIWKKNYLKFNNTSLIINIYTGVSIEDVEDQINKWINFNYYSFFNFKTVTVPLYSNFCIAILSKQPLSFQTIENRIDLLNIFLLASGITIFFLARKLSKKVYLYYSSCVILGILGSLLILTIYLSRNFSFRSTFVIYVTNFIFNSYLFYKAKSLFLTYPFNFYIFVYIFLSAIISFSIAYYKGPNKNTRFFDLIQWLIQFISIIFILNSSEYLELNFIIILIVFLTYKLNLFIYLQNIKIFNKYQSNKYETIRFLTLKEYEEQGERETRKALNELRQFCSSPDCNKWKLIKRVKNIDRLANFIEGEDHLSKDEILQYDYDMNFYTDNSDTDNESI